jgi:hypothetical protein
LKFAVYKFITSSSLSSKGSGLRIVGNDGNGKKGKSIRGGQSLVESAASQAAMLLAS